MNGDNRIANKASFYLALGVFILLLISMGWGAYLEFYPFKMIEFKKPYLEVENKVIRQGEVIRIKYDFKKYVDFPATVSRAFINSIVYTLPITSTPRSCGEYSYTGLSVSVPEELPPGVYFLRTTYSYDVPHSNRSISTTIDTEKFEVAPSKKNEKERALLNGIGLKSGPRGPAGAKGDTGEKGETGKRGPGLFGK
jgi:hypothetical protein